MPSSPAYQVFLWPGRGLVLSSSIVATAHRHDALQLTLGLDGPFRLKARGGGWTQASAALVASAALHELDGQGRTQANLYVEPESRLGRELASKFLGRGPVGLLPAGPFHADCRRLAALARRRAGSGQAFEAYAACTARLRGVELAPPRVDARILRALRTFHEPAEQRPSVRDLAQQACLSESRLSHLFVEQMGMPIKRYLLWMKVLAACERVNHPDNITQAAHAAGFTDSAHLTHSLRRLLGVSPRTLFDNRSFVRVVTAADPRLDVFSRSVQSLGSASPDNAVRASPGKAESAS